MPDVTPVSSRLEHELPVRGVAEDPLEDTGGGVQQARDAIGPGEPDVLDDADAGVDLAAAGGVVVDLAERADGVNAAGGVNVALAGGVYSGLDESTDL